MWFKIWYGTAQNEAEFASMRPMWTARQRSSLHDALWDAMRIIDDGRLIVWEIESEDGVRLSRQEVGEQVRKHRQELNLKPPQTY